MFHNMKLGAHRPIFPANRPMLTDHKILLRQAPPKLIRDHTDPGARNDANSDLGDCTAEGIANEARAQAAIAGYTIEIPKVKTVGFYSQSTGYSPTVPNSDQGGVELLVLANAAQQGFDGGQQTRLFPLWGSIDQKDLNGIQLVSSAIGPPYLGVALALADQAGGVWDTDTPANQGDPAPGSWGYHCLLGPWSYTGTEPTDVVELITWGMRQKATWRWLQSRITEAHAVMFRQLLKANVLGVDYDRLAADNAAYLQSA